MKETIIFKQKNIFCSKGEKMMEEFKIKRNGVTLTIQKNWLQFTILNNFARFEINEIMWIKKTKYPGDYLLNFIGGDVKIGLYHNGLRIISSQFDIALNPTRREIKNLLQFLEENSNY